MGLDNPFVTDGQTGGEPGGNIRVAMLWRADQVTLDSSSVRTVSVASGVANPFDNARNPLVADFTAGGVVTKVLGEQLTSKVASSPLQWSVHP